MHIDFDWDKAKAASNLAKHGVSFDDAMTIFADPLGLSVLPPDSMDEERWVTIGQTLGWLAPCRGTHLDRDGRRSGDGSHHLCTLAVP